MRDLNGPLLKLFSGGYSAIDIVISFFSVFVIIFVVFPIHEWAHAAMAKYLGDDTAELEGRLTLNPIVHIDPIGALVMLLFPIGWAKPVFTQPQRCTRCSSRTATGLIAVAGPAANLIIAYLFMIFYKILTFKSGESITGGYVAAACFMIMYINVFLALLNLLPLPQFDGLKFMSLFIKPRIYYAILERQQTIQLVFIVLFFVFPVVPNFLGFVAEGVMTVFSFLTGYIDLIFRLQKK